MAQETKKAIDAAVANNTFESLATPDTPIDELIYLTKKIKETGAKSLSSEINKYVKTAINQQDEWYIFVFKGTGMPFIRTNILFANTNEEIAQAACDALTKNNNYPIGVKKLVSFDEKLYSLVYRLGINCVVINGEEGLPLPAAYITAGFVDPFSVEGTKIPFLSNPTYRKAINEYCFIDATSSDPFELYQAEYALIRATEKNEFIIPLEADAKNLGDVPQMTCEFADGPEEALPIFSDWAEYRECFLGKKYRYAYAKLEDILENVGYNRRVVLDMYGGCIYFDDEFLSHYMDYRNSRNLITKDVINSGAVTEKDIEGYVDDIMKYEDISIEYLQNEDEPDEFAEFNDACIVEGGYTAKMLLKTTEKTRVEAYHKLAELRAENEKKNILSKI